MPEDSQPLNERIAEIGRIKEDNKQLSPEIAVSTALTDYENKSVVFNFAKYNQSQCEICKLDKIEAKKLTKELGRINRTLTKHLLCRDVSGIDCKRIHNSGNYKPLFLGLPKDAELLQIDYTNSGRIFGYLSENIFNIVAITKKHF
ncbi:MAG: hypothetical protein COV69_02400 [Parcubacteria group bacterium CG11_big_fil_rev_8_21_14_0_20_39_14]|nr:MAG: hypothetical protein COV69_02400 [Parcubacteria group bacterium CG11_big_fil_rev_8_21_14_0_20_39_14]PIS35656.1 MAG: hypothetical protein COT36_01255 [Parcubacteria group bacterium CG08_land_8_20_14_0_20_38_56]